MKIFVGKIISPAISGVDSVAKKVCEDKRSENAHLKSSYLRRYKFEEKVHLEEVT